MKLLLIALMLAAPLADDTDLVKAAKRKPARGVITNETVRKNATKSGGATGTNAAAVTPKSELLIQAEQKVAREAAELRLHVSEGAVTTLEHELAAVELSYYEENNPDVRDRVLTQRFAETKEKLASARVEFAAAREAVEKLASSQVMEIGAEKKP